MSRTLARSALLLFVVAFPPAILRADEPNDPVPVAPVAPARPPAPPVGAARWAGDQGVLDLVPGNPSAPPAGAVPAFVTSNGSGTYDVVTIAGSSGSAGGPAMTFTFGGLTAAPNGPTFIPQNAGGSANWGTTVFNNAVPGSNPSTLTLSGPINNLVPAAAGASWNLNAAAPRPASMPAPAGPVFYLITEGAGVGDSVKALPCIGKETVLSAIGALGGISQVSSRKIWVARPSHADPNKSEILTVDWDAISKRGIDATNYTLLPGDRLVIGEDALVTQTNLLAKKSAPIERLDGIIGLTTSTMQGVRNTSGAGKLVKDLVEKNLLTDDEQLKKTIMEMIVDQEQKQAAPKSAEDKKPQEGKPKAEAGALVFRIEQGDEKSKSGKAKEGAITFQGTMILELQPSAGTVASVPHELAMQPLPAYRIEPPDVIQIEMLKVVPLPPYRAQVFDVLQIRANALPDLPIDNYYMVEAEGEVNLGPPYGTVNVAGKTIPEMKAVLDKSLVRVVREPDAYVQLARVAGAQPVTGQYLVGPDGTINLRRYGLVSVSGKTVAEARAAIEAQLGKWLKSPEVSVDVAKLDSKRFYVITQGAALGDNVRCLPVTGNETVLSAIGEIGGLSQLSSSNRIRVVRPSASGQPTILPVDWDAITRRGETATNYQIMPGDRVYIGDDPLVKQANLLAKKSAPLERAMGIIDLTTSTVQGIRSSPGGAAAVKELLGKGVFDDDPEVKRIVQEVIRLSEESDKKNDAEMRG